MGDASAVTDKKRIKKYLNHPVPLPRKTLISTADGILVMDEDGDILTYNKKFLEMWKLSEETAAAAHRDELMESVLDQLKDPGGFVQLAMRSYARPDAPTLDVVEFKDGRIFERYTRP